MRMTFVAFHMKSPFSLSLLHQCFLLSSELMLFTSSVATLKHGGILVHRCQLNCQRQRESQNISRPHNDIQEVSSVVAECVIFLPNSLLAFRSNDSEWRGWRGEQRTEARSVAVHPRVRLC